MAKKLSTAFNYNPGEPHKMQEVLHLWNVETPEDLSAHLRVVETLWKAGVIQLRVPRTKALKLISTWEVI